MLLCVAAPPLVNKEWGVEGTAQYIVLGVMLLVAAMLGLHEGGAETRAADGLFVAVLFVPSVAAIVRGGADLKDLRAHNVRMAKARVAASALSAATLFYGSARTLRLSLLHASSTRTFRVWSSLTIANSTEFSTLGYGLASLPNTGLASFGAATGMGAAMVLIALRWKDEELDASDHSLLMGVCGTATLTCAFCLLLTLGEHIDTLPALYGAGACDSTIESCAAAFAARRFALANTPVPQTLLTSLGMFIFGFPEAKRLKRRQSFKWSADAVASAAFCALVVGIACAETLPFDGDQWYVDVLGCVMLLGAALMMWDTSIGTMTYLVALVLAEILEVNAWGLPSIAQYVSHVMLWIHIALLGLHWLLTSAAAVFGSGETLDAVIGAVSVMGASLALFLCLSTLALMTAVNGGGVLNLTARPVAGARAVFSFFYEHFLPVVVWGFLYACRCEVGVLDQVVGKRGRQTIWVASAVLAIVINSGVQSWVLRSGEVAQEEIGNEYTLYVDDWPLASSITGIAIFPWLAAAAL